MTVAPHVGLGTRGGVNTHGTHGGHGAGSSSSAGPESGNLQGTVVNDDPSTSPVIYTCQVEGFGTANGVTFVPKSTLHTHKMDELVADAARAHARAPRNAAVTCGDYHTSGEPKPDQWLNKMMAPNCAAGGYQLRDITAINHYSCEYAGTGLVDGKQVHRPHWTVKGKLASCDGPNEYGKISDSLMSAVKRAAYHRGGGAEAKRDPEQFVCLVSSLPGSS